MAKIQEFQMPKDDFFGFDSKTVSVVPVSEMFYEKVVNEVIKNYNSLIKKITIEIVSKHSILSGVSFVRRGNLSFAFCVHIGTVSEKGIVKFSFTTNRLYGETLKMNECLSFILQECGLDKLQQPLFAHNGHLSGFVNVSDMVYVQESKKSVGTYYLEEEVKTKQEALN